MPFQDRGHALPSLSESSTVRKSDNRRIHDRRRLFTKQFPNQRIEFVPCFHENNRITAEPGKSDYIYIMASYPLSRMNEPCYFSPSMFSAN